MVEDGLSGHASAILAELRRQAVPATGNTVPYILFFSVSDGQGRAAVVTARGKDLGGTWRKGLSELRRLVRQRKLSVRWLRVDHVDGVHETCWGELRKALILTKRNYFRHGISLDSGCRKAFLETELNANAMLYGGPNISHCVLNEKNFQRYARLRHGLDAVDFGDETPLWLVSSRGLFVDENLKVHALYGPGPDAGRRIIDELGVDDLDRLIGDGSGYLGSQVNEIGRFRYGWHPCFDRSIDAYNALRHASSLYALIESWEVTGDAEVKGAIDRGLAYLTKSLIVRVALPSGEEAAFLVDVKDEIKLGGNAVCLLALVKYTELTGDRQYMPLLEALAAGILFMQQPDTGGFVHVLHYPSLAVKEEFRIIYYDGEAAFGLMRLYDLTRDSRWIDAVERAFAHFIAKKHWKAHDHWLSYCVNELTLHRPKAAYFEFGVRNFVTYLDFVIERITTFPTLLELMMAAEQMIRRLVDHPERDAILKDVDLDKFHYALKKRAHHMLNGHFWPELAMFFARPSAIVGSFFIRHHAFRVRIDDVEHYLSGYVAYRKYLIRRVTEDSGLTEVPPAKGPVVAWGGDINLGRRQHYRTAELGLDNVLRVPALAAADIRIANLECAVTTRGEQGTRKGEDGPYYYRARPEMLRLLAAAGIDMVTTANNHSGDYGPDGVVDQAEWLDRAGIGHAGTGRDVVAAFAPLFRRAGDLTVAIFSLDSTQHRFAATPDLPGSAYLPPEDAALWRDSMAPRIAAARAKADVVLVAVHWGVNLAVEPDAQKIAAGHALIEAGADAVLGASAHVLQGIEIHQGRPIIHDAGDLLFDSVRDKPFSTGLFSLELSTDGVERVVFTPLAGSFGSTAQLAGSEAVAATRRFGRRCEAMGTSLTVAANGAGIVDLSPPARAAQDRPAPAAPMEQARAVPPLVPKPPLYELDARWRADAVPEDARIDPVRLGPLTLLGVRVKPRLIRRRRMLWVETFWRADAPVAEDWRLDIRGVPVAPTAMKPWGMGMAHDPCDWLMPTSRWEAGHIYRDYYGLRPPYLSAWDNVDLALTIGLVSHRQEVAPVTLPFQIKLAVPPERLPGGKPDLAHGYRTEFPEEMLRGASGQTWTADQLEAVTGGKWLVKPPAGWFVRSVVRGMTHVDLVDAPALYVASHYDALARHEQYSKRSTPWDTHGLLPRHADRLAGAIVAHPVDGLPADFPLLQVDDPIRALIELGLAARQRYEGDVIAITGTAGKSSTVGMLRQMLDVKDKPLATFGNYNSRVGAPSLLASLAPDHGAAIVEVAQTALWMKRGPVTRLLRPTVALVTEVGISQADSNRVRSVEDTAKWKSRIFDGLTDTGVAVLGEHLACFDIVLAAARKHAGRVVTFGESEEATLRVLERHYGEEGSRLKIRTPEGKVLDFHVPLPGPGMANNALAAIAVLYATGRDLRAGARRLAGFEPEEGRLCRFSLPDRAGGAIHVIDDSWNATVSSMRNALAVFKGTPVSAGGRRIAVLGRIVDLGGMSQALHESLAEPLLDAQPDLVVTHGEEMAFLRAVLPAGLMGPHFTTASALADHLRTELRSGDLVLVKGSRRDSDFGKVCEKLVALAEADQDIPVAAQ